jgi:hypothetical protein
MKLLLGFLLVAVITCIVGITGFVNLCATGDRGTELYKHNTVPLDTLEDITSSFLLIRVNVLYAILQQQHGQDVGKYLNVIEENQKSLAESMKLFDEAIDNSKSSPESGVNSCLSGRRRRPFSSAIFSAPVCTGGQDVHAG